MKKNSSIFIVFLILLTSFSAKSQEIDSVSGDKKVQPILGFSTEGAFHSKNIPENLRFWLGEYDKEIQSTIESPATNSTSDVLHIETTEKLNGASLSLYDINGRLLLSDKIK